MKPMEVLEKYPGWHDGITRLYVPNAVKNLATERELSDKGWGRTWVSVYKDRVELKYQNTPYHYTSHRTHTVIHYNTVEEMVRAIERLIKLPQASCWD